MGCSDYSWLPCDSSSCVDAGGGQEYDDRDRNSARRKFKEDVNHHFIKALSVCQSKEEVES